MIRHGLRRRSAALVVPCMLSVPCLDGADATYLRYNADGDGVQVQVGEPVSTAADEVELTSTTGTVAIGTGSVSPDAGPVGTEHALEVRLDEAYADQVDRVFAESSSSRGSLTHELIQDSADTSYWRVDVESLGDADEARTDTFTFLLWRLAAEDEAGESLP